MSPANISHRWTSDPVTHATSSVKTTQRHSPPRAGLISATPMENCRPLYERTQRVCSARRQPSSCCSSSPGSTGETSLTTSSAAWRHWPTQRPRTTGSFDAVFVDWAGALAALDSGRLPCSSTEGQMLRIAAGLAEGIPIDLRHVLIGLDARTSGWSRRPSTMHRSPSMTTRPIRQLPSRKFREPGDL